MKLVKCPVCGAPQLLDWTLDQYSLSDRLHCHACGYRDFVYVFLERDDRHCIAARLGDNFADDLRSIADDLRPDTAMNALLSSLSRRYRLSTFAMVEIINALLASENVDAAPDNPLNYLPREESTVDASLLLRRVDAAAAEARAHISLGAPAAASESDADRWRLQYEQTCAQLNSLNDRYEHLRAAFETLKAENRRLREYLGE